MKRVLISGYYGCGNLGDELLLEAIVTGLRARMPDLDLVVPSAQPEETAAAYGVRSWPRTSAQHWWRELAGADLLISGGGSLLQDASGPWTIPYYGGIILAAAARGVPVMIFGQGIGPLRSPISRRMVKHVIERAALVTVRDEGSCELLRGIGVEKEIILTSDPALTLAFDSDDPGDGDPPVAAGERPLRVGVALRRHGLTEGLSERLAAALSQLASEHPLQFVFFPMDVAEDVAAAETVAGRMRCDVRLVKEPLDRRRLSALLHGLDFVIGMRLHALIAAALAGVPFASINVDPKLDGVSQQLRMPPLLRMPALPNATVLAATLAAQLCRRDELRRQLAQALPALRREAERPFDLAASLLQSS